MGETAEKLSKKEIEALSTPPLRPEKNSRLSLVPPEEDHEKALFRLMDSSLTRREKKLKEIKDISELRKMVSNSNDNQEEPPAIPFTRDTLRLDIEKQLRKALQEKKIGIISSTEEDTKQILDELILDPEIKELINRGQITGENIANNINLKINQSISKRGTDILLSTIENNSSGSKKIYKPGETTQFRVDEQGHLTEDEITKGGGNNGDGPGKKKNGWWKKWKNKIGIAFGLVAAGAGAQYLANQEQEQPTAPSQPTTTTRDTGRYQEVIEERDATFIEAGLTQAADGLPSLPKIEEEIIPAKKVEPKKIEKKGSIVGDTPPPEKKYIVPAGGSFWSTLESFFGKDTPNFKNAWLDLKGGKVKIINKTGRTGKQDINFMLQVGDKITPEFDDNDDLVSLTIEKEGTDTHTKIQPDNAQSLEQVDNDDDNSLLGRETKTKIKETARDTLLTSKRKTSQEKKDNPAPTPQSPKKGKTSAAGASLPADGKLQIKTGLIPGVKFVEDIPPKKFTRQSAGKLEPSLTPEEEMRITIAEKPNPLYKTMPQTPDETPSEDFNTEETAPDASDANDVRHSIPDIKNEDERAMRILLDAVNSETAVTLKITRINKYGTASFEIKRADQKPIIISEKTFLFVLKHLISREIQRSNSNMERENGRTTTKILVDNAKNILAEIKNGTVTVKNAQDTLFGLQQRIVELEQYLNQKFSLNDSVLVYEVIHASPLFESMEQLQEATKRGAFKKEKNGELYYLPDEYKATIIPGADEEIKIKPLRSQIIKVLGPLAGLEGLTDKFKQKLSSLDLKLKPVESAEQLASATFDELNRQAKIINKAEGRTGKKWPDVDSIQDQDSRKLFTLLRQTWDKATGMVSYTAEENKWFNTNPNTMAQRDDDSKKYGSLS